MTKASWVRLQALITKEGFQIIKDPSSILISAVLPLLLLFLYAYGVSLDLNHLNIGLVLEDTTEESMDLAGCFLGSRYLNVRMYRDRHAAINDLQGSKTRGFAVVSQDFSKKYKGSEKCAEIQVITDGSEPNTANFVASYVNGVLQIWQREQGLYQTPFLEPIRIQPRYWYNEELESRYFLLPGSLAIIMTLIGTLLTALVVSREWERGTMEALIATPVRRYELILGKLIPYFCLGMVSMVICFTVSVTLFHVPFRGSLLLLALTSALFLCCALGLGLMISTLAKNQIVAYQTAIVTGFLPAYILSGFLFEISSMPLFIRWLTYLLPARYFVQCLQTLFLVGNVWKLLIMNMVPMLITAAIFLTITTYKTRKSLE